MTKMHKIDGHPIWDSWCCPERGGHKLFRSHKGLWAISDDSAFYPEHTDDGVIWLDFDRPVQESRSSSYSVPVTMDDGTPKWTQAGRDEAAYIRSLNPNTVRDARDEVVRRLSNVLREIEAEQCEPRSHEHSVSLQRQLETVQNIIRLLE